MFGLYPFLMKLYADGGYQGPLFRRAVAEIMARVNVEIVKRFRSRKRICCPPKRWVVERTFAWLGRCRRLAKRLGEFIERRSPFLRLASIRLMLRKLCILNDLSGQTLSDFAHSLFPWLEMPGRVAWMKVSVDCVEAVEDNGQHDRTHCLINA